MALIVEIGADWGKLKSGLKEATQGVEKFSKNMSTIGISAANMNPLGVLSGSMNALLAFGPIGLGIAAAAITITTSILGIGKAMDQVAEKGRFAEASGLSITQLAEMEAGLGKAGIRINEMPAMMSQMRMHMKMLGDVTQPVSVAFARLGISADSFKGKTAIESLQLLGKAMREAKNSTDALDAATMAFGQEKGPKMMSVLMNLPNSAELANPAAGVMETMAPQVAAMQGMFDGMKDGFLNFFVGVTSKITPLVLEKQKDVKPFQKDMLELGEKVGDKYLGLRDKVSYASEAIYNGTAVIGDALNAMAKWGYGGELFDTQKARDIAKSYSHDPEVLAARKLASEKAAFGVNKPGINEPIPATKPIPVIAESLTKVGGGGFTWGGDMSVSIQREQLVAQNRMVELLGRMVSSTSSPSRAQLIGITPEMATQY
jgi:hypothetical protein